MRKMPIKEKTFFYAVCEVAIRTNTKDFDNALEFCHRSDSFESIEDMEKAGWVIKDKKVYCPNCIKPITNNWTRINYEEEK